MVVSENNLEIAEFGPLSLKEGSSPHVNSAPFLIPRRASAALQVSKPSHRLRSVSLPSHFSEAQPIPLQRSLPINQGTSNVNVTKTSKVNASQIQRNVPPPCRTSEDQQSFPLKNSLPTNQETSNAIIAKPIKSPPIPRKASPSLRTSEDQQSIPRKVSQAINQGTPSVNVAKPNKVNSPQIPRKVPPPCRTSEKQPIPHIASSKRLKPTNQRTPNLSVARPSKVVSPPIVQPPKKHRPGNGESTAKTQPNSVMGSNLPCSKVPRKHRVSSTKDEEKPVKEGQTLLSTSTSYAKTKSLEGKAALEEMTDIKKIVEEKVKEIIEEQNSFKNKELDVIQTLLKMIRELDERERLRKMEIDKLKAELKQRDFNNGRVACDNKRCSRITKSVTIMTPIQEAEADDLSAMIDSVRSKDTDEPKDADDNENVDGENQIYAEVFCESDIEWESQSYDNSNSSPLPTAVSRNVK